MSASTNSAIKKYKMSSVAQAWIVLDGKNFNLSHWPMHLALYDGRYPKTLMVTSRQVAKSTTMSNFMILESCLIPHFKTMFVSPTKEQTTRFSVGRVNKTMKYSPVIHRDFLHSTNADRVLHKEFSNGSEMYFAYGIDDADRLRGVSTDRNMYDEVQDLLYDPIVTVGNETLSNSDYQFETYAGTPKTMENTIQYLWEQSTQTEWVMKCSGCGIYQFVATEKSIGKSGPICLKCGKYLNPFLGQWIDMNPIKPGLGESINSKIKGFHYGQVIMPFNVPEAMKGMGAALEARAARRWESIFTKFQKLPIATFRNEVLGVSDSIGTRLLSKEELNSFCTQFRLDKTPNAAMLDGVTHRIAGVDWSGGGTTGISRSVLWIWGWHPRSGKLKTLYYQIFPGKNPIHVVDEIQYICKLFDVHLVLGDAGEGHLPNSTLASMLGQHRVFQIQYCSQKVAIVWNGIDRYTADRTTLIDNYFMLIKRGGVEFLHEDDMRPAFDDILNEFEEVTNTGKKVWKHSMQKPDDCLHAGLFGWIANKIILNDLKFYQ